MVAAPHSPPKNPPNSPPSAPPSSANSPPSRERSFSPAAPGRIGRSCLSRRRAADRLRVLRQWKDDTIAYGRAAVPGWSKQHEDELTSQLPDREGLMGRLAELGSGLGDAFVNQAPPILPPSSKAAMCPLARYVD